MENLHSYPRLYPDSHDLGAKLCSYYLLQFNTISQNGNVMYRFAFTFNNIDLILDDSHSLGFKTMGKVKIVEKDKRILL